MALDRRCVEPLLQFLADLWEKNSLAIASSESFDGWANAFETPALRAIADRRTFNGTIIRAGSVSCASPIARPDSTGRRTCSGPAFRPLSAGDTPRHPRLDPRGIGRPAGAERCSPLVAPMCRTQHSISTAAEPSEPGHAVPDLLEILESVATCAGSVSDYPRSEPVAWSDRGSQVHVRLAAIVRMTTQVSNAEPETGMPLDWARQAFCFVLDRRTAIAGTQHQRFHVTVKPDRPVDLCLYVTVQGICVRCLGELDQCASIGDAERRGLGGAVRVAESSACESLRREPEVRGAESRSCAERLTAVVQRAVDRALVRCGFVIRSSEDTALPAPSVSARVSGQSAVTGPCGEL